MNRPNWHTRIEDVGGGVKRLTSSQGQNADCSLYAETTIIDGEEFTHGTRMDDGTFTKHPCRINLNRFKQPLRIEVMREETIPFPDGDKTMLVPVRVMLRPIGSSNPAGVRSVNRITYSQVWSGLDLERIITPEGIVERYTVTSAPGQRAIEWAVSGDASLLDGLTPRWTQGEGIDAPTGAVPWSLIDKRLTFDLTGVPVGGVVE